MVIHHARQSGFTLDEIRELFFGFDQRTEAAARWQKLSERKLTELEASIEQIKSGQLHALAVTTTTRSEALPDVPAVSEFVTGYDARVWSALGAPRNTPTEIVDKLNKETNVALADPKMKARLADLGATVLLGSPGDFRKFERED